MKRRFECVYCGEEALYGWSYPTKYGRAHVCSDCWQDAQEEVLAKFDIYPLDVLVDTEEAALQMIGQ